MAKYYYNGVLLPEIPADVLANYPYAWIRKTPSTGYYDLFLAAKNWFYNTSYNALDVGKGYYREWYRIEIATAEDATEWTYYKKAGTVMAVDDDDPVIWSNHDIPYGSSAATTIYYYGSELVPETPPLTTKYLVRSISALYTITDGVLTPLTETELSASLFQTYGVDEIPDGSLLMDLTDPEVLYWQDSTEDLPVLSMTITGTSPVPQVVTSGPLDLTHETIMGISHAEVTASADVLFAVSFNDGATWLAHNGTAWYSVTDETPGMTAGKFTAITAEQWAEVVVLDVYLVRFWLPNTTASVTSVVLHYINP